MKLALPSSLENHYEMLRLLYTGCQGIVEVQGYVLIAHVSVHSVPLDNLRIIRGSQLYNSSYALAACRHFNDSGTCKDNCPPPSIYDPNTFQSKPNKDKKFNFGATCVKQCPHNYLAMEVACTMVCPKANKEVITVEPDGKETQKCEKCEGECPKVCYGLGMGNLQGVSVVDATNIGMFVGCEKIYGSLAFLSDSFKV
ncbi:receptor tyrosine-protein kinase erbB-2-like [Sinocyclocheilus grahami]|uniref:receptor tyrosine-protein kinase erbB-2-like n=1 Tax=Sinocyclocheilus grahami TaxID=75366 RepID=UPI0007AC92E0|nr:PREDICTED: receptor tyrosine-protein kinase erbB-2-like [Sinocyclocheilus grahami]